MALADRIVFILLHLIYPPLRRTCRRTILACTVRVTPYISNKNCDVYCVYTVVYICVVGSSALQYSVGFIRSSLRPSQPTALFSRLYLYGLPSFRLFFVAVLDTSVTVENIPNDKSTVTYNSICTSNRCFPSYA
jgi:hypothetical protein